MCATVLDRSVPRTFAITRRGCIAPVPGNGSRAGDTVDYYVRYQVQCFKGPILMGSEGDFVPIFFDCLIVGWARRVLQGIAAGTGSSQKMKPFTPWPACPELHF